MQMNQGPNKCIFTAIPKKFVLLEKFSYNKCSIDSQIY